MGQLDNTIVVFTTDNGAETITFPDGGITPFKGRKLSTWEGGMRAPMVIRWPGVIKPGTVKNEIFAVARLAAHACRHRRRTKGRRAEEADRGRPISRHRQDHARRRRPERLPRRQVGEVGARYFFYYSGQRPIGGALQELEDVLHDARPSRTACHAAVPFHFTLVVRTSSAIPSSMRLARPEDGASAWAARCRAGRPPTSTTGTCCRSASSCG